MKTFPGLGSRSAPLALAFGMVLSSTVAFADPIRVTFGFLGSGGDDTGFVAVSPTLSFSTGAMANREDPVVVCNPCTPGSSLNLSANVTISNWGAGSATVNGQTYNNVFYSGSLFINGGSVIVPDVPPQPDGLDYNTIVQAFSTFTFTGTVNGFADPGLTMPLFTADLVGGGNGSFAAEAGFANVGSGVFLDYADYHIDDLSATPEPGSLLLLGSGLAWCVARGRRPECMGADRFETITS